MPKFKVEIPYIAYVTAVVESPTEEDAVDAALEDSQPTNLVGNGGTDKMIGVGDTNEVTYSIECGEGEVEGDCKLEILVSEI